MPRFLQAVKLRRITRRPANQKASDLRPRLNDPHGRLFGDTIGILGWVLKHNPYCEYLIENVGFDEMTEDWKEICSALGSPVLINAQDYSYTKCYRAY